LAGKVTVQPNSEIIKIYPEMQSDRTVQSESKEYSIDDLEKILRVKRRQILNYSKVVTESCWEPEIVFKPSFGKFSPRMLEEMRKLQGMGATEYRNQCAIESKKPSIHKIESALTVVDANPIVTLDSKIANLQQTATTNSQALADRIRDRLANIARQNHLTTQRIEALDDAELLAAENRGLERALEIFEREKVTKDAALAQLRTMELGD
jgi:hypothetical protein